MKKLLLLTILGLTLLTSCENMDDKVSGVWTIKGIYQNNESIFDTLSSTGFLVNKDKTCTFPLININNRHTSKEVGTWKTLKKGEQYYLQIITDNELFNDTYEIKSWEKVMDEKTYGYAIVMFLESDKTKMELHRSDF